MIRVGVVGAGLIGKERLTALRTLIEQGCPIKVSGVFDASPDLCQKTAAEFRLPALSSLDDLLNTSPDWVMVALPHDVAVSAAETALCAGTKVLLEKPMGRDLTEAARLLAAGGDRLWIGFNYRFYQGISRAFRDIQSGRFGDLISIDFLLGHGCFPGQEKTWKLDGQRSGGGCLIDPGVHMLDLCIQIAPSSLTVKGGSSWQGFWKTGIEEDVSLVLSSGSFSINLRVSIVHWKSTLRMCINGTDAYGVVNGRNRTYGNQSYVVGPRWGWRSAPNQAASEVTEVESDGIDVFTRETEALLFPEKVSEAWPHPGTAKEGYAVMQLLDDIRKALRLRRNFAIEGESGKQQT